MNAEDTDKIAWQTIHDNPAVPLARSAGIRPRNSLLPSTM
jgi:hypothetical protein